MIFGENGSHHATPSSKDVALRTPGPGRCCTTCLQDLHSRFPVQIGQQVDDINHHSQGTFFQALHWSVEATCMLDSGLNTLGLTLSQNKSVVVASHPHLLRAVRRELLEQGLNFEGASSVRDVGLDANAGQRRSVKIQNKREQKCRKRNTHIKVIQKGLKSKHQATKLLKTGILPAMAYGHAGMGMCPSSIQREKNYGRRHLWYENQDSMHYYDPTFSFWRICGPWHLVPVGPDSYVAGTSK